MRETASRTSSVLMVTVERLGAEGMAVVGLRIGSGDTVYVDQTDEKWQLKASEMQDGEETMVSSMRKRGHCDCLR